MDKLDVRQLKQLLQKVARLIIESEPYLTEIDTVIGDGDHGTGMKCGFTAVQKMLSESEFQTIDALVRAVGMEPVSYTHLDPRGYRRSVRDQQHRSSGKPRPAGCWRDVGRCAGDSRGCGALRSTVCDLQDDW